MVRVIMYFSLMRISRPEFESLVRKVIRQLPPLVRRHLDELTVEVRRRPARALLREMGMPPGETLLGLYTGTNRLERSAQDLIRLPDSVILFQEPLMDMCRSRRELEKEIADTLVHETAHYLGMEEDRLEELGYG
jgi:predicted Zn-dependent protease with MMP-like domain